MAAISAQVLADGALKKFFVYVVNRPFYGYEPPANGGEYSSSGLMLREYSRSDVLKIATDVLDQNAVEEHSIGPFTNLLIVPDHWDGILPMSSRAFKQNIRFLYFSLILHPSVVGRSNQQSLQAPIDAGYRILLSQTGINPDTHKYWALDKVALDTSILEKFRQRGPLGKLRMSDATTARLNAQINGLLPPPAMFGPSPNMASSDELAESPDAIEKLLHRYNNDVNQKQPKKQQQTTNSLDHSKFLKPQAKSSQERTQNNKVLSFSNPSSNVQLHAARLRAATMTMSANRSLQHDSDSENDEYTSEEEDNQHRHISKRSDATIRQKAMPTYTKEYADAWRHLTQRADEL